MDADGLFVGSALSQLKGKKSMDSNMISILNIFGNQSESNFLQYQQTLWINL